MAEIWTDGAVGNGRAGIGVLVKWKDDRGERELSMRVRDHTGVNECGMVAIGESIRMLMTEDGCGRVIIRTDSRVAIAWLSGREPPNAEVCDIMNMIKELGRAGKRVTVAWEKRLSTGEMERVDALAKGANEKDFISVDKGWISEKELKKGRNERALTVWQRLWDSSTKGRVTYRYCKEVGRDAIGLSSEAVQMITGHGNMRAYLNRFRLQPVSCDCECGGGAETSEHIMWECEIHERKEARIESGLSPDAIVLRMNGKVDDQIVGLLNRWAGKVIRKTEWQADRETGGGNAAT